MGALPSCPHTADGCAVLHCVAFRDLGDCVASATGSYAVLRVIGMDVIRMIVDVILNITLEHIVEMGRLEGNGGKSTFTNGALPPPLGIHRRDDINRPSPPGKGREGRRSPSLLVLERFVRIWNDNRRGVGVLRGNRLLEIGAARSASDDSIAAVPFTPKPEEEKSSSPLGDAKDNDDGAMTAESSKEE